MIDDDFGLELWAEAGTKTLAARKQKLADFKNQLLSTMPEKKKIKPDAHTKRIFEDGDLIAIQLQTNGKSYNRNDQRELSDDEFHSADGKYILIQLIQCSSSWTSSIVPEVKDYWADFRLFDGVYDVIPENINIHDLKDAKIHETFITPLFTCECSLVYFKRRNYKLIGCFKDEIGPYLDKRSACIFLGINREWQNPDSDFLASMGKEIVFGELTESNDSVDDICRLANRYARFMYHLSREKNEQLFLQEESIISRNINNALADNGIILKIDFGKTIGIITVVGPRIDNLYIIGQYQRNGFGTNLLKYALSYAGKDAYIDVPQGHSELLHICEKIGLRKCEAESPDFIRMVFDPH
jgi:GNAT superfamily N-acetyltransferase